MRSAANEWSPDPLDLYRAPGRAGRDGRPDRMVSKGTLRWIATGLVLGIALALGTSRAMGSMIYGVEPLDWTSLVASAIVLWVTATAAALLPVWRAARITRW